MDWDEGRRTGGATDAAGAAVLEPRVGAPLPQGTLSVLQGTARRWLVTPGLVGFVASPRVRRRPMPLYRALHRVDPVHRSPIGVWLIASQPAVAALMRSPAVSSDESNADMSTLRLGLLNPGRRAPSPEELEELRNRPFARLFSSLMLFLDPPDHPRIRSLVSKAFTPRRVEALEPRVHDLVEELLEPLSSRKRMEFLSEFAYPLPARVICELLGVPAEDCQLIMRSAPAIASALDPAPMRTPAMREATDRAVEELTEYLGGLIESRRLQPRDDLLSALVQVEADGDRLSHDELLATVILLLIAGHETTANVMGNGLLSLLQNPDQLDLWRGEDSLDKTAVEELLRFDGPINMAERVTMRDVEIPGGRIPAGRIAVLLLAAANRDPRVFANPHRLDLRRDPNPHVAFGGGPHFCLGASLARMEARVALPAVIRRYPALRLDGPRPRHRSSFTIRGLESLPLAW